MAWFDEVSQALKPAAASAGAISCGTLKVGNPDRWVSSPESGVSRWQIARSADEMTTRTSSNIGLKSKPLPPASARALACTGVCRRMSPDAATVKERKGTVVTVDDEVDPPEGAPPVGLEADPTEPDPLEHAASSATANSVPASRAAPPGLVGVKRRTLEPGRAQIALPHGVANA